MPVEVRRCVAGPPGAPPGSSVVVNKTFGRYKGISERLRSADAAFASCSQLYEEGAREHGCRANEQILEQLPKTPGSFGVIHLNCGCNYIGDKGLMALLPVVEVALPTLRRVKLSDNGLGRSSVVELVRVLRQSTALLSIDLSGNKALALEVGTQCLAMAKGNTNLMHVSLAKTSVSKQLQDSIEKQLKLNRSKNGARNREALENRQRIDRKQIFDLKQVFDSLDFDKSGCVSVHELMEVGSKMHDDALSPSFKAQREVFRRIDSAGAGEVTFLEYVHAAFPRVPKEEVLFTIDCCSEYDYPEYKPAPELTAEQVEEILAIFRLYDKDRNGRLTVQELSEGLKRSAMCMESAQYITQYDKDGDGMLSPPEFVDLMKDYYLNS